jgi:hypothetical protein
MQVFRITLRDGIRKFRTTLHAPDAAAAETKAAYYFDTSKWQILSVTHTGALLARFLFISLLAATMNQKSSLREDPRFVSWVLTGNTRRHYRKRH